MAISQVYITGGGCSGFSYGFTFDDKHKEGDSGVEKNGVQLVVDPMSYQYLIGKLLDLTLRVSGVTPASSTVTKCSSL
jgi:iron-sulfur cluster assembly accessory protein